MGSIIINLPDKADTDSPRPSIVVAPKILRRAKLNMEFKDKLDRYICHEQCRLIRAHFRSQNQERESKEVSEDAARNEGSKRKC